MRLVIVWNVAVLVVFTSASCRPRSSPPLKAVAAPTETYQTRDGLRITPVEAEQSELAAVLGVKWWRFHIVPPSLDRSIRYRIELRKKGEPPREIANSGMWAGNLEEGQMVVALCPIEGEISSADRLKTYVRIAGASASNIMENPLKGLSSTSISPTPKMQTDESFTLVECSQSGRVPDPNNTLLVLTIHIGEPRSSPPP